MQLTGFVLAGGRSTRMGTDKAQLDWHGRSLLEHMLELVRTVADPALVVGRDPLPDLDPGHGPLSGIATGLRHTSSDANLFLAVDLPFLSPAFLHFLRDRIHASSHPLLACKIGSAFPLCLGVWRPMLPEIIRRLDAGRLSVRHLIRESGCEIVSEEELYGLGFDASLFRNINTEEDYRQGLRADDSGN